MSLTWNPNLDVGVPEVDRQHRNLFATIDRLLEAGRAGRGREEVGEVMRFLETYVVEHFGLEERLMREAHYPRYAEHKAEHEAFIADFGKLKAELHEAGPTAALMLQVNERVSGWLWHHIARIDKAFGLFLAARSPPPDLPP